ncbi:hypothetical protein, unlikely [Trypanosoma brucei gambiense DAL972]|uniref:Uncharacterized protein n=1 Tax=Trypanosoma brucei gambiense (strain MHOM/CI/86/DAL972) TaxID=679716 RepID=D0A2G2_TRYB9|nr:hypothetical protein, unlikely [Trypanosoma brucei gambiense DAL972]CBH15456.1 hypothetical protein, unlikely [Trypanosoma brucei gambiense DAL972]|eukprot:XP_011777720.1 hypothetical protein, unlikely [Trypanosoma brucei gambiense DAL972]
MWHRISIWTGVYFLYGDLYPLTITSSNGLTTPNSKQSSLPLLSVRGEMIGGKEDHRSLRVESMCYNTPQTGNPVIPTQEKKGGKKKTAPPHNRHHNVQPFLRGSHLTQPPLQHTKLRSQMVAEICFPISSSRKIFS